MGKSGDLPGGKRCRLIAHAHQEVDPRYDERRGTGCSCVDWYSPVNSGADARTVREAMPVNHIGCASQIVPVLLVVKWTVEGKRIMAPDIGKVKFRPGPFCTRAIDADTKGDGAGDNGQMQVVLMFLNDSPAGCRMRELGVLVQTCCR
jgi:hypothetical protein